MTITKEQLNEYINENWDQHFYKALVECVREQIFCKDAEEKEDYREELKQLIYSAVSHGVKDYLNEYNGEAVKIMTKEFASELSKGNISISFK